MTDLDRAGALIRKKVKADWDEAYLELGAIRLGARRVRRTRAVAYLSVAAACAVAVAGVRWRAGLPAADTRTATAPTSMVWSATTPAPARLASLDRRVLRFSDGSLAIPEDNETNVSTADDTPSRMVAVLESGRSRFEVIPNPSRMFAVRAGSVTVVVIGTVFTVERNAAGVFVSVERGRVRIESPAGEREMGAGENAAFVDDVVPVTAIAPRPTSLRAPAAAGIPSWRALAEQRRFQEAYRWLPDTQVIDTPRDLLLAADGARLSGHPEAAVKYLAKIVSRYPKDFSAQLAAFSLGNIYLDQLNRPGDAAFRFGQARTMAGTGALAEDALARQLEAWARSGNAARAHERAEEYLRLFPTGRHVDVARKLGGLD